MLHVFLNTCAQAHIYGRVVRLWVVVDMRLWGSFAVVRVWWTSARGHVLVFIVFAATCVQALMYQNLLQGAYVQARDCARVLEDK